MDLKNLVVAAASTTDITVSSTINSAASPSSLSSSPPVQKSGDITMTSPKSLPSPEPSPSSHFFPLPQISSLRVSQQSTSLPDTKTLPKPSSFNAGPALPRTIKKRKSTDMLSVIMDESSDVTIPANSDEALNIRRTKRRAGQGSRSVSTSILPSIKRESSPPPPPSSTSSLPYIIQPTAVSLTDAKTSSTTLAFSAPSTTTTPAPLAIALTAPTTISSTSSSSRRHAHILSEQRRRENINGGFQLLKNSVPFCKGTQDSKAMILKKAVDYIVTLEQELNQLRYQDNYHYQMMSRQQQHPIPNQPPVPQSLAGQQLSGHHGPPPPPHHHHHHHHSLSHQPQHMRTHSGTSQPPPFYPGGHPGPSHSPVSMYDGTNPSMSNSPTPLPGIPQRSETPPSASYLPSLASFSGQPPQQHQTQQPHHSQSRASSFSFPRSVGSPYYYQLNNNGTNSNNPSGSPHHNNVLPSSSHLAARDLSGITRPTSTPPLHSYLMNNNNRSLLSSGAADEALQFGNQIMRPQTASIAEKRP